MKWADDDIKELTRIVFRHAGNSVDYTKMKVESEVHLINKELNVTGRANMVISKNGQHLVVVDCKRAGIDYSKDTAQMMLAAEILLTEKLKNDESSSGHRRSPCWFGRMDMAAPGQHGRTVLHPRDESVLVGHAPCCRGGGRLRKGYLCEQKRYFNLTD
ncbi:hypothetical protein PR003_g26435 [Phytophthora rubi]|uniref:Uncharacterized protein n=1 Tax=Phytophthora rubi TaxID=129364 RepID=A0A6A4C846_9STRA|nr:hypothetical protein PR003_g26435 [Phytophthora rubi]